MHKRDFLKGMAVASKISSRASNGMPQLKDVLIKTNEEIMSVRASDLTSEYTFYIDVVDEKKTDINACVSSDKLKNLIALSDDEFTLSQKAEALTFSAKGAGKTKLSIAAPDFFPKNSDNESLGKISISAKEFCQSLKKCDCPAPGKLATILTSVNTKLNGNKIDYCSTDGYRLVHTQSEVENKESNSFSLNIPSVSAQDIVSIYSEDEGDITLEWGVNTLTVSNSTSEYKTRLVEGKYPDYNKILPKNFTTSLTLNKSDIMGAIKRAEISVPQDTHALRITVGKDNLTLISTSSNSSHEESIQCSNVSGNELSIGFNIIFLKKMIGSIDQKDLIININDPTSPVVITSSDSKDNCMLMPIK